MKKFLFSLIAVVAVAFGANAQGPNQIPPYIQKTGLFITNTALTIPANTTVTIASTAHRPMPIQPGVGFAFQPIFTATNEASVAELICNIELSLDGTNYSTFGAISVTNVQNGTNTVIGYFEVPPESVNNALWARLGSVSVGSSTNSSVLIGSRWQWRVAPWTP